MDQAIFGRNDHDSHRHVAPPVSDCFSQNLIEHAIVTLTGRNWTFRPASFGCGARYYYQNHERSSVITSQRQVVDHRCLLRQSPKQSEGDASIMVSIESSINYRAKGWLSKWNPFSRYSHAFQAAPECLPGCGVALRLDSVTCESASGRHGRRSSRCSRSRKRW